MFDRCPATFTAPGTSHLNATGNICAGISFISLRRESAPHKNVHPWSCPTRYSVLKITSNRVVNPASVDQIPVVPTSNQIKQDRFWYWRLLLHLFVKFVSMTQAKSTILHQDTFCGPGGLINLNFGPLLCPGCGLLRHRLADCGCPWGYGWARGPQRQTAIIHVDLRAGVDCHREIECLCEAWLEVRTLAVGTAKLAL